MTALTAPADTIYLGMGCFWGAQKRMAELPGVIEVETGYANGETAGSYASVQALEAARKAGQTRKRNHAEVVKVRFDPRCVRLESVLAHFWQNHDPTQGDRQGMDIGSQYRSAIYTTDQTQLTAARRSRDVYQAALKKAGYGRITTDIAPLVTYFRAEEYHQDYMKKNPDYRCGLRGTGVPYPVQSAALSPTHCLDALDPQMLDAERQLIVFEASGCPSCQQFKADILDHWRSAVAVVRTQKAQPPIGWTLEKPLFATPTIVLFEHAREVARFTGYDGDRTRFWQWLGFRLLDPEQRHIAFEQGTERPGTGSHLDEKRPGTFVDPITGAPLFRSETKYDSGSGWPSFFEPVEGALTFHPDRSHGMIRTEVRSASSGIHLGHVFDDGPPPTGKRYCINGKVLKFVPDPETR